MAGSGESVDAGVSIATPQHPSPDTGPIPMSFPSLLRNPGLSEHFVHLRSDSTREQSNINGSAIVNRRSRDNKEGKRWIRRKDNARFTGNPHIVTAAKKDYNVAPPTARTTFPEPLPVYLSRNAKVPSIVTPTRDPLSANAGRFSLSLKGMRRDLRKAGGRAQYLVRVIEDEIMEWLWNGGVLLAPDTKEANSPQFPGTAVGDIESIKEVSRTPLELIWSITDDPFARYVVHCCARYHEVVSFSKDTSGHRLTHLLRPNVTRPDFGAIANVATPPETDLEFSSHEVETDFDFSSDRDSLIDSDTEQVQSQPHIHPSLDSITEQDTSTPSSPALIGLEHPPNTADNWSVIGDSDHDMEAEGEDDSGNERLSQSFNSLTLHGEGQEGPAERTPLATRRIRHLPRTFRSPTSIWDHRNGRSASSPSRSPARRLPRRVVSRIDAVRRVKGTTPRSFHDYLFA